MKQFVKLLPILLLITSSCVGDFDKAQIYFSNGQYEKAVRETNRLLFFNSADISLLNLRARSYIELERYDEAIRDYEHILRWDPRNAVAYAGIGKIHWLREDFISAEYFLLRAVGVEPNNVQFLVLLARAMIKNKNYQKANEFLFLAKEIDPSQANVYFYRGIAQAHLGDVLGTAVQFNAYLRYSPDNLTAHYNRGFAFLQMGMTSWALEDFEFVLKEKPDHYEALARRAVCIKEDSPARACEDLRLAASKGSKYAQAHLGDCAP
jgi:Flp pilus assembly protein TadD